jgi:tetratricopeptide (TPR) repeat protein
MLTFFWKASFVNLDQDCKERGWIFGRDIMRRILNLSLVADYDTLHLNQHTHMISNALLKNSLFVARIHDIRGKAIRLNNIGGVYQDGGKPQQALEYYQKALEIFEELQDERSVAIVNGNIESLKK